MREMADNDILYDGKKRNEMKEIMSNHDYESIHVGKKAGAIYPEH